jgi:hypothetical protein
LDQNLREPEVVGCCIENAVQHDGHISFGADEASLSTFLALQDRQRRLEERRYTPITLR